MFDHRSTEMPHVRLTRHLNAIGRAVGLVTAHLRAGRRLSGHTILNAPDDRSFLARTELLFLEETGGRTSYIYYNYSSDLKQMNPICQFHLMHFFADVLKVDAMVRVRDGQAASHVLADLSRPLDRLATQACFFARCMARFDLAVDMISGVCAGPAAFGRMDTINAEDRAELSALRARMFAPDAMSGYFPIPDMAYPVVVRQPYQDGQQTINGVCFLKVQAETVLARMGDRSPEKQWA